MSEEKQDKRNDGVMQAQVGVKGLIYDKESKKFLVLKAVKGHHNEKVSPWELPGGRMDEGETNFTKALSRELQEEVGDVEYDDKGVISRIICRSYGDQPYAIFINLLYLTGGDIELSDEHEKYKWIANDGDIDESVGRWLNDTLNKAKERIEQLEAHDKMLRTLAEFDNYKKRQAESQKEFAQYANEGVIRDMLPVLDNFHAATAYVPEDQKDSPWLTGIMHIQSQMDKVFEEQGVTEIEVKEGDVFDAETMEAIKETNNKQQTTNSEEGSSVGTKNPLSDEQEVAKVVQKGYKIKEKMLRPARVTVAD